MALLQVDQVREQARQFARSRGLSVEAALAQAAKRRRERYDIFLSQTMRDAEIVLGVYAVLTRAGYTVFCDWVEAPLESREEVSADNAAFVRAVMGVCDTLLFIDSPGAAQSLWMCWELGWFDGGRGPVGILPVTVKHETYYFGREFLGLYPYVDFDADGRLRMVRPSTSRLGSITIMESTQRTPFDTWRTERWDSMRPRVWGGWRL